MGFKQEEMNNQVQYGSMDDVKVIRKNHLAQRVVFVDGQPGCGKTLFSPIIAALDRVELLTYSYEIEYICALYYLGKITDDAAIAMARVLTDVQLYNTMMSRKINFRPSDLSSAFRDANPMRYIRRLFQAGDEAVPLRIEKEKPILHLTTHNLVGYSEPIFAGLGDRAVFIEIVRHPLYMIKQQDLNMEDLTSCVRDFDFQFQHKNHQVPFYAFGWEDLFASSNSIEKAIYSIEKIAEFTESSKKKLVEKYNAQILTIPFEGFVIEPQGYMKKMETLLGTKSTSVTHKMMKKQNVPRKMYAQGIGLKIYKRCGWESPKAGATAKEELQKRRNFAKEKASPQAMEVLDRICQDYEKKYMGDMKNKGESHE